MNTFASSGWLRIFVELTQECIIKIKIKTVNVKILFFIKRMDIIFIPPDDNCNNVS